MYCLSECFPTCNIPMGLKHKVLVDPSHLYVWIKAAAWQSIRVTEKLWVWQGNRDTHKAVERNESEKEYKTLSYFFNFQRNGTDVVFITAVISTSGPCISQVTLFSPVKYHRPITDDCSVAAYVTHHHTSNTSETDRWEERGRKDNCGKWKLLYDSWFDILSAPTVVGIWQLVETTEHLKYY